MNKFVNWCYEKQSLEFYQTLFNNLRRSVDPPSNYFYLVIWSSISTLLHHKTSSLSFSVNYFAAYCQQISNLFLPNVVLQSVQCKVIILQDGLLKEDNNTKLTLIADNGRYVESVFTKADKIAVGDEIESDAHLILIDVWTYNILFPNYLINQLGTHNFMFLYYNFSFCEVWILLHWIWGSRCAVYQ